MSLSDIVKANIPGVSNPRALLDNFVGGAKTTIFDSTFGFNKTLPMQRTYNWDIFMWFTYNGIPGPLLSKYCQSIKFGNYNIADVTEFKTGAFKQFYAGLFSIDSVTMSFVVPIPDMITSFFLGWRNHIVDEMGNYGLKSNYSHNIYILLNNLTGIPFSRVRLEGAFPRTYPVADLSYENEGLLKYNIDISVDKIKPLTGPTVVKDIIGAVI